jgi:acyl-homoserine-lactone acylase
MRRSRVFWAVLLAAVTVGTIPALARPRHHHRTRKTALSAVIRRTAYGIPHIESSTWVGLGYGYGYAFAQDNLCTGADDYVTVDAQRSRYFGPDATYEQRALGLTVSTSTRICSSSRSSTRT